MGGTGCIIKSKVFCDVNSVNVHVKDANSFAEYANLLIDNIKSPYLSVNDVREEPDDIDSAPKILSTLYVHQVKREFNLDGVSNFHFFKVVSDSFSFQRNFTGNMVTQKCVTICFFLFGSALTTHVLLLKTAI